MTGRDQASGSHTCGGDAAAYVLGALDPDEVEAYVAHLHGCAVCRDEIAALSRVVNALSVAVPQHPLPSGLRGRVLDAARDETRSCAPSHRRGRRLFTISRPGFALAACALLAVAVGALAGFGVLSGGPGGARVLQASVLGSPGSAKLRVGGGHAELVVSDLEKPPAGMVYEIWLTRPGRPPAPTKALFSVTTSGAAAVTVPGDLHGVSQVLVTEEPPGGSLRPTHPALIVARLT